VAPPVRCRNPRRNWRGSGASRAVERAAAGADQRGAATTAPLPATRCGASAHVQAALGVRRPSPVWPGALHVFGSDPGPAARS
jgi:hypothetical protein